MKRRNFLALAGAAAAFPRVALAQQAAREPRVALVANALTPDRMFIGNTDPQMTAFFEQMQSHGLVEGRTVLYERYRVPTDQGASLMPPIVAAAPDLIFSYGSSGAALAKIAINQTIPMVVLGGDLLAFGIVDNVAHPGGNVTGISTNAGLDYYAQMLALLAEAIPGARRFGYVSSDPNGRPAVAQAIFDTVSAAAVKLGVALTPAWIEAGAATEANYARAFAAMAANKTEAAFFGNDSTHSVARSIIARLALAATMPIILPFTDFTETGSLLGYSADMPHLARQGADYVALILAGAKPRDLPVLQPTVYDFLVNLKTAKAIGITIPRSILVQATQVIE